MVASGQVQSYFGEFLCDVVDRLIHPRDGPSNRELGKEGYELLARKGNRLNGVEIWVKADEGGKIIDIRAIDYQAGGLFQDTKYATKFESKDDARAYFAQYDITDEQFAVLESGIKLWNRREVWPEGAIDPWTKQIRDYDHRGKRIYPHYVYS